MTQIFRVSNFVEDSADRRAKKLSDVMLIFSIERPCSNNGNVWLEASDCNDCNVSLLAG